LFRQLERARLLSYARSCRLAILGNATFDLFLPSLKTVAFASGIELVAYNGAYNQHLQEVLNSASGLHDFKPGVIVLATDWRSLALPEESSDPEAVIAQKLQEITQLWSEIAARLHCHIIQYNFVSPEASGYGGLSARLAGGRANMIRQLNLRMAEAANRSPGVSVLDVDEVASIAGKRAWEDARMWIAAKQSPATGAVALLARHLVALLRAILGAGSKCLVLDLDNTLWGGVIGEDGLAGIQLGGNARARPSLPSSTT
jgi:predicted enzyme involved in methoxymalonyl-ACP biosynthesis